MTAAIDHHRNVAEELGEIREQLTHLVALTVMLSGLAGSLAALAIEEFNSQLFIGAFLVGLSGLVAYLAGKEHPIMARAAILLIPTTALATVIHLSGDHLISLFAVTIVVANAAIDARLGFAAAILESIVLLLFLQHDSLLMLALTVLWLTTLMAWLTSRGLHATLNWAWQRHTEAERLLEELRDSRGELRRTLVALTEASERLARMNRELIAARHEADQARTIKEQFVSNVSHELRTPLNLVVGFVEMMYLDSDGYEGVTWTPDLLSDIGETYRAARHLQSLVNDILDLSRIDAAHLPMFREMQPLSPILVDAIETIIPLVRQRNLFCRFECPESVPLVFVDATRIRQVMLNLLNNAIRYTDEGGITVVVETYEEELRVSIQDTGAGIATDQLDRLFERFHQGEAGLKGNSGTGLGLALSRQFITMHGGRLWAESTPRSGSTFLFSLPLPGTAALPGRLRRTPEAISPAAIGPVIVVDPDPSIADMLERYLDDRPTIHAASPTIADSLIDPEHPSAILVNVPPGQSDARWLGDIGESSRHHGVPIMRCSIPSPSWLSADTDLDECLTKPITRSMLSSALKRAEERVGRIDCILVADDDPGFPVLVERMLRSVGYKALVLTAYSGIEALRLAEQRDPQVVLLDIIMPDMNGLEVAKELRRMKTQAQLSIMAVTATSYASEALRQHCGYVGITRSAGIRTAALVELLSAVVRVLHPDYSSDENS